MKPGAMIMARVRETIREELFPRGCALCGKALYGETPFGANAFYGLCGSCRELLSVPAAERGRCSLCGQPLVSERETCVPCRTGPARSFDRILPLFPYAGKYQKILAAYKFEKRLSLGNFFAEKLRQGLETLLNPGTPLTAAGGEAGTARAGNAQGMAERAWVPVPPRPGKIKQKGWDQIEYLAGLLEGPLGSPLPVRRCLARLPSESQKELKKENRLLNLKGRIIVKRTARASRAVPKTAILFDDVYTTGTTMDACACALKSGGAEKVYGICLCYD